MKQNVHEEIEVYTNAEAETAQSSVFHEDGIVHEKLNEK
jgi:hypothetical protein